MCAIRDYIETKEAENFSEVGSVVLDTRDDDDDDDDSRSNLNHTSDVLKNDDPSKKNDENPSKRRHRVIGLHKDIEVLKAELLKFISEHGQEGFMPMRSQLRKHGRFDMEKAISRRGGFRKFASLMNLSLAYKDPKPKGYWDQLENLNEEVSLVL